jgi:hypothetical protein
MFRKIPAAMLAAFVVAPVSVAYAADPPAATYHGKIQTFNQFNPQPDPSPLEAPGSIATGGAQLTIGDSPTPFLRSSAAAHGDDVYSISGILRYYFTVDGPQSDTPIDLAAHIVLHDDQQGGVSEDIVYISAYQSVVESLGAPPGIDYSADFNDTVSFKAMVGVANYVEMTIGSQGLANVYADPFISIDTAFAAQHPGYTLSFSAGVSNLDGPGAVPEPASWALMIGGIGMAGAALRRRKAFAA